MMEETLEERVSLLETEIHARDELERMYSEERKLISNNCLEIVKIQANSLSIPIMKDVLVPMGMRVFTFFALLVLLLLGGVLGIKWAIGDVSKALAG